MDASTRFYNVYGKTNSGASALSSTRGALSSSARQLLILIDGQRSVGDLTSIFGGEALDRSLALLESEGYVEIVRHFPETEDSPAVDGGAFALEQAPSEPTNAAPRRSSTVPVVLAGLIAIMGIIWLFAHEVGVTQSPKVSAAPLAAPAASMPGPPRPAPADADEVIAAPKLTAPEPMPLPVSAEPKRSPVHAKQDPASDSKPIPALEQRAGESPPARDAAPATSRPAPANANPAPGTLAVPAAATAAQPPSAQSGNVAAPPAVANERPAPAPAPTPVLHVRDQVTPQIPKLAKALGINSGHVVVVLHVTAKGTVERVELVSATPPEVYDQDMEQVFGKWTFDPGQPGRMTVEVDLRPPK
jgi:TonB family protein